MTKYSKNAKLNAVLNDIEEQLLNMCDTEAESLEAIGHYMWLYNKGFSDYNIAQHGNLLYFCSDVYDMYRKAGYKSTDGFTFDRIWETYKRQVGYVARDLMKRNGKTPSENVQSIKLR